MLASRLNSKFRCLSCDRPLPAIGPPGPPKLGAKGMLSVGGAGMPPSPQRYGRPASSGASKSRPGSPSNSASHADTESDVVGWGAGSSTRLNTPPGTIDGGFGDAPESPPTGELVQTGCGRQGRQKCLRGYMKKLNTRAG